MLLETITSQEAWNALLKNCVMGNISQSWRYGQGMAATEGWTPQRFAVMDNDTPLAAVQVFTRKFKGIVPVARLQRGPLFVANDAMTVDKELEIVDFLVRYWKQKKHVLYFSPNLDKGSCGLERLHDLGLHPGGERSWWSTMCVDLTLSLDELRANLKKDWRRHLRIGEKNELTPVHDSSQQAYDDFMHRHLEFATRMNIHWPPESLIRAMLEPDVSGDDVNIITVLKDGRPISGALNLDVGNTCFGFLSWADPEFRRCGASHFTVWESMKSAKERGMAWLDTGGFDAERSPGIASFKRGLRGREFELVGAFHCFPRNPAYKALVKFADWRRQGGIERLKEKLRVKKNR